MSRIILAGLAAGGSLWGHGIASDRLQPVWFQGGKMGLVGVVNYSLYLWTDSYVAPVNRDWDYRFNYKTPKTSIPDGVASTG
jgi:hypothetical protein